MGIKFSTGLPNCREGRLCPVGSVTIEGMLHVARVADELGYYSLWPNELFTGRADVSERYAALPSFFDAIVTMSCVVAVTRKIRLTSSTIVLPLHEPIVLSRQIATLDVFSGGRVTLGVGLGGKSEEFHALHANAEGVHRGDMMDEYIQALRLLWTVPRATFNGRYAAFTEVTSHTRPVQDPLPIFVAGPSDGVLRRVARSAQGWIVSRISPEQLRVRVEKLRAFAAEAGRGDERFEIARQFYVSIGMTQEEADANFQASWPPSSSPLRVAAAPARRKDPGEFRLIGTPDLIISRLNEYVAAGATELAMIFYYPDAEAGERQLELFAREVMPVFA